jgi:hypothetical protein
MHGDQPLVKCLKKSRHINERSFDGCVIAAKRIGDNPPTIQITQQERGRFRSGLRVELDKVRVVHGQGDVRPLD